MKTLITDMMELFQRKENTVICVTTNGFVKNDGTCVMGRGIAKQIADRIPELPSVLGNLIKLKGNHVHLLWKKDNISVVSFPVKPAHAIFDNENSVAHMRYQFKIGNRVPGWACKAELEIIKSSALELCFEADAHQWKNIFLPRPGCGAGELKWKDVSPILEKHLDDRFTICSYSEKDFIQ